MMSAWTAAGVLPTPTCRSIHRAQLRLQLAISLRFFPLAVRRVWIQDVVEPAGTGKEDEEEKREKQEEKHALHPFFDRPKASSRQYEHHQQVLA